MPTASTQGELLLYAAEHGDIDGVRKLIEQGADLKTKDIFRSTPLHRAVKEGHLEVVELLLEARADPNAQDSSGSTPLHIAAKGKNAKVAKALVDAGADKGIPDKIGFPPPVYPIDHDVSLVINPPGCLKGMV